jgi:hypothetical protein
MADLHGRHLAAKLLADFLEGAITNDEYDNEFPDYSTDAGLEAVYWRIWFYYSDLESHYLNREELSDSDIALFKRCIEFLKTDFEYEGPPIRVRVPIRRLFQRLLGGPEPQTVFGSKSMEDAIFFTAWWPFASADQQGKASRRILRHSLPCCLNVKS